MMNSDFGDLANGPDFYPEALRTEIDAVNERVYHDVNNGVYKSGFATKQSVYEQNVTRLFETLDWLEAMAGRGGGHEFRPHSLSLLCVASDGEWQRDCAAWP